LNQDCLVEPGWLATLLQAFEIHQEFGIAGCTILNPDGTVNHAGATIRRPDAYGIHLIESEGCEIRRVEYVTGAAFATRRQVWDAVGRFDEGYYPAYYEESDYCYRARRKGFEIAYVPQARVTHLFSSHEWQADPLKHAANQHRSRYRFISKHFDSREISEFFEAECAAIEAERYFDHAIGRAIAARDTLRGLADILERRRVDLGEPLSPTRRCQLQVGFTQVLRQSFAMAEKLGPYRPIEPFSDLADVWQAAKQRMWAMLSTAPEDEIALSEEWQSVNRQLQLLRERERELLTRIYFRAPSDDRPESALKRLFRLLILRPLSFLVGRDYLLLAELNTVHVARMDQMDRLNWLYNRINQVYNQRLKQTYQLFQEQCDQIDRRLTLLELLTDYDYR